MKHAVRLKIRSKVLIIFHLKINDFESTRDHSLLKIIEVLVKIQFYGLF